MDNIEKIEAEESSIDFKKIFNDLLKHKRLYYKVLPIAFVLAAIYALSKPNFYSCTVKLSPDIQQSRFAGQQFWFQSGKRFRFRWHGF